MITGLDQHSGCCEPDIALLLLLFSGNLNGLVHGLGVLGCGLTHRGFVLVGGGSGHLREIDL